MATQANIDAAKSDHALVIGIAGYPNLGAKGTANDLGGPVFDALAVADWLVNDAGVPSQNVTCVTSSGIHDMANSQCAFWPDQDVRPRRDDIEGPLARRIRDSLIKHHQGHARLGRRIWIYCAGHGFTPSSDMSDIALLMSDALERGYVPNLAMTKFADWITQYQAFDEVVLWLDCCAETRVVQRVGEPFLPNSLFNTQPPKRFYVIAAPTGRLAYEDPTRTPPQGIFTQRLLAALRGDARVSATGHITSEAIRDFFKNTGSPHPESSVEVPEPEVSKFTLMDLVHLGVSTRTPAMAPSASTYTLHLGVAAGTVVEILGAQLQTLYQVPVGTKGEVQVQLAAGLYCAKDQDNFRSLFQIEPGAPLDILAGGTVPNLGTFTATHSTKRSITLVSDIGSELYVVGGDFGLLACGGEELRTVALTDGLYKLKVVRSGRMVERIVEFPADGTIFDLRLGNVQTTLPNLAEFGGDAGEIRKFEQTVKTVLRGVTPAIAEMSAAADVVEEGLSDPLAAPAPPPSRPSSGKTALVLAAGVDKGMQDVFSTLRVVGATFPESGVKVIDAQSLAILELDNQNFRAGRVPLRQGVHTLSADVDGMTITMAIPLVRGKQTRVFARRRHVTSITGHGWMEGVDLSVQVREPGADFVLGTDDLSEVIRKALTNGRRIIIKGELVNRMLEAKYDDPLVGIAGAHLMLAALERMDRPTGSSMAPTPDFDKEDLGTVLQNMRRPAVLGRNADIAHGGQVLPDIVALYVRAGLMGKRLLRVTQAPLYWESWRVLLDDKSQHAVLDPRLLDAAPSAFAWGPYLVFSRPKAEDQDF
jgi:hypothetical protein